jgi:hypothetical protein
MTSDDTWSRRHWLLVVTIVAAVQLGMATWVLRPPMGPRVDEVSGFLVRRAATSPDPLAGGLVDPTQFALPDPSGFSGAVSGLEPRIDFRIQPPTPRRQVLEMDADARRLGALPASADRTVRVEVRLPDATPVGTEMGVVSTQAMVTLGPGSESRRLLKPLQIPAWPQGDLPQSTRIEFAINPAGRVVLARIDRTSSSRVADLNALAAIRAALFEGSADRRPADDFLPTRLTWMTVSITPPPATASPSQ